MNRKDIECRRFRPTDVRAVDSEVLSVEGYAAVFDSDADIGGKFIERIERGAFKDAIGRDDVVFLINHEGLPLARTRSGTLSLSEDEHGLKMSANLEPEDPDVRSIIFKMKRGDMDKMSFAFRADVEEWDDTGSTPTRTIKRASLYDVSIVNDPAYQATEIGLRSLNLYREAKIAFKPNHSATRLRMKGKLAGI